MPDNKPTPSRKPTGQELDQQYDEQHRRAEDFIRDEEHPSPEEERRLRDEAMEDYAEGLDLKDPD